MADEEKVSLIVEGKDKASAMLEGFGGAITAFNQGLEIAKKGFELFKLLIADNITAMIEYRGELDPVAKQLRRMGDEALYAKAVIFDLLTPVILGLGDAFRQTGNDVIGYVNTNRQLIATNITTFLADVARVLTGGIAEGLLWASRAVSGLIEAWNLLASVVETAIAGSIDGIEGMLRGLAAVSEWAGRRELAASFEDTANTVALLGQIFSDSADQHMAKVEEQVAKQQELEAQLKRFKAVAVDFVGEAEAAILDRIAAGWSGVRQHVLYATDAIKNQREAWASLEVSAATYYERLATFAEKDAAYFQQREAEKMAAFQTTVQGMAGAFTAFSTTMINESEQGGIAVMKGIIRAAQVAVQAYIAQGMAAAAAANAGIPGAGWIVAGAAAAVVGGLIESFMAKIPAPPQAALGGVALGGMPGRDSIAVLVQHEEGILRGGQTALLQRLGNTLERLERNGQGGGIGGNRTLNLTAKIDALDLSDAPQKAKQILLHLAGPLEELVEDGVMLANLQRRS